MSNVSNIANVTNISDIPTPHGSLLEVALRSDFYGDISAGGKPGAVVAGKRASAVAKSSATSPDNSVARPGKGRRRQLLASLRMGRAPAIERFLGSSGAVDAYRGGLRSAATTPRNSVDYSTEIWAWRFDTDRPGSLPRTPQGVRRQAREM